VQLSDGTVIPSSVFERIKQLRAAGVREAAGQAADEFASSSLYGLGAPMLPAMTTTADLEIPLLPERTFGFVNTMARKDIAPIDWEGLSTTFSQTYGKKVPSNNRKKMSFGAGKWGQLADSAAGLAGSLGGAALGNAVSNNKGNNFAQEGASIGTTLGMQINPIIGIIGGLAGGMLGGMFGKNNESNTATEALQKIERNTREAVQAFENQTALLELDSRFLNVPTAFAVPAYRPGMVGSMAGAGSVTNVNNSVAINVTAGPNMSTKDLANEVAVAIRQELGRSGSSFDIRTM